MLLPALCLISLQCSSIPMLETLPLAQQPGSLPRRGALGLPFSPPTPDQVATYKLSPGEGLVAMTPVEGLTGAKAGIRAGDLLIAMNGKPVKASTIGTTIRDTPSGQTLKFSVIRDGKPLELTSQLTEKPRDPGTSEYTVTYSHIVSDGKRMRTIITTPTKPGKHPGFMFIQGFSPISYDFTLATSKGDVTSIDGPLLHDFAKSNFVTMRVEKPGVGDSEGGPFAEVDYTTELDIYRKALIQLKDHKAVDPSNLFIFGHSMGGSFGPMIACEIPVKGIAVYGTAGRTWFEYLLDTVRYQGLVGGGTFEQADDSVRLAGRIFALAFYEDLTAEQIKKAHPELAPYVDEFFPGGLFNQKTLKFWSQLGKINFATYWSKVNAHVYAVRGASDFVTYDADHKLIADIVNRANPGFGKFEIAPSSDHLFHNFATEPESMRSFSKGTFNLEFSKMMKAWMLDVMAKK